LKTLRNKTQREKQPVRIVAVATAGRDGESEIRNCRPTNRVWKIGIKLSSLDFSSSTTIINHNKSWEASICLTAACSKNMKSREIQELDMNRIWEIRTCWIGFYLGEMIRLAGDYPSGGRSRLTAQQRFCRYPAESFMIFFQLFWEVLLHTHAPIRLLWAVYMHGLVRFVFLGTTHSLQRKETLGSLARGVSYSDS
jgi:hypothetical protein